jgi:hypothetical protein
LFAVLSLLLVVGVGVWLWMIQPPPQLANDPEVFDTVDALFTAVTAHNERLLGECESRLKSHQSAGKLPDAAASSLDAVIRRARSGAWQPAAEQLYTFMMGQRREGK